MCSGLGLRIPAFIAVGVLFVLAAESSRADNPFRNSYRFRSEGRPESGEQVAERIRATSAGGSVFGRGRGERQTSMAPATWLPSPVVEDRRCAQYCLAGVAGEDRAPRPDPTLIRRPETLFLDLLDSVGGGEDDGVWFLDGGDARRLTGGKLDSEHGEAPHTYFWDGASAVLRADAGTASVWEPGSGRNSSSSSSNGNLPESEVYYWHGPDQSEVVRTTEYGLDAISSGAPAWYVSMAGFWEVHSWGGSSSYQVTGDTAHELFFTHGERTLTMMDGLSGDWEDDVNQLVDPSQWLLYMIRNREALQDMERDYRRR